MITTAFRAAAWTLVVIIVTLSVVPPFLRPVTPAPHDVEHFAIFALCGLAFGLGYRTGHVLQACALVIFSGAIEILQRLSPGRHARMSDFVVDAAASCAGIFIAWVVLKMPRRADTTRKR